MRSTSFVWQESAPIIAARISGEISESRLGVSMACHNSVSITIPFHDEAASFNASLTKYAVPICVLFQSPVGGANITAGFFDKIKSAIF